eukprot:366378-Chlamydomonas_euryale.AAC.11
MTAEELSQNPHLHRRLAAAGKAFKEMLPALRCPCSMRPRAMLYRVYVVPALLSAVTETSALQTCSCSRSSAPTTPACAGSRHGQAAERQPAPYGSDVRSGGAPAAGVPQLMHILNAA